MSIAIVFLLLIQGSLAKVAKDFDAHRCLKNG